MIAITAAGIAVSRQRRATPPGNTPSPYPANSPPKASPADPTDPLTARQLAVAAWHVFPTGQANSAMTTLLAEQQRRHAARRHRGNGVNGVAFSPDGKLLASADGDGTVRLWNPATGQPVGAPLQPPSPAPGGGVTGVAFSPDGKLLATADADGTVRLWNPATGQPVGAPLPADARRRVNGVAFSPDGKLLASADSDGTVRLWNPVTGQPVGPPLPRRPAPMAACTGWRSARTASCWPAPTATAPCGCGTWPPAGPSAPPSSPTPARRQRDAVAFSPDGKLLATADDDGTVRLWNPATGRPVGAPLPADPDAA